MDTGNCFITVFPEMEIMLFLIVPITDIFSSVTNIQVCKKKEIVVPRFITFQIIRQVKNKPRLLFVHMWWVRWFFNIWSILNT